MQKIFYGFVFLLSTAFTFQPTVSDKVSKAFQEIFPNAKDVKWQDADGTYEVTFTNNRINCNAKYDENGNMLTLRRDYYEDDLPIYVKAKVKEKYPDKKVFGITEVSSVEGVVYTIVLEDEKNWTTVQASPNGDIRMVQKLKKS